MKSVHAVILDDHITPYRLALFERLASEGLRTTVLFCSRRLPEREWAVPDRFGFAAEILPGWVLRLPRHSFRRDRRTVIVNFNLLWRLIRLNPDVVVGYAFSLPGWTAFLYARLFRKPYVAWSTDTLHTASNLDAIQRLSRRVILRASALCLTPSLQGVEQFRTFGVPPERIRVAPQTMPASFGEQADRARAKSDTYVHRQGLTGKVILYVGFLTRSKGMVDLIQAFSKVVKEYGEVQLLLVGSGPLDNTIVHERRRLGLDDRIHLAGFVQPSSLPDVYAGADVFVFPTHGDTFGVVVAEAIACGLPVVCSRYAGTAGMLVEDGFNGFIVDPRNHRQMKDALLSLLRRDDLRSRMAQASQEMARRWNCDEAAARFRAALVDAGRPSPG
ncbi:MAG: glycosyl transferase group 1 [Anaerolineales bacterium]|nr:glycosyl transferase group 1 [Anaerolineales bacterium]